MIAGHVVGGGGETGVGLGYIAQGALVVGRRQIEGIATAQQIAVVEDEIGAGVIDGRYAGVENLPCPRQHLRGAEVTLCRGGVVAVAKNDKVNHQLTPTQVEQRRMLEIRTPCGAEEVHVASSIRQCS